ncbi:rRNA maturation RNase YbeY [Paenibacillus sp. TRM 82003]|uniref:rRNA maturation RNase YbeY n=1 Tax=Kineococcus sp. TRM81007 TaxID=2925831 RepID=UPI001F55D043|nr:rRNA maturation RNase YbeY [Kineococcus sp. TRM81007]MCI2240110.1 rRNA maturation RNase YbeY [Kineococcus sp. TRM81007]MCI3925584.1 rRNA maturation RNase YbeY [Paenibacillus sp. TRM 82003]
MSIDVVDESTFAAGRGVDTVEVAALARHVLDEMRVHPLADLSVLMVDGDAMSRLHEQWMDEPGPTDVMSFPMDQLRPGREGETSEPGLLGDVVVCPEVAAAQAAASGHATADEVLLLVTHGILHLLGYDHAEPEEEREMFTLQRRLVLGFLARIGRPGDPTPTVGHRALPGSGPKG